MKTVLDVGQCDADHARIGHLLARFPEVRLRRAKSLQEAVRLAKRETIDLVLVNRLLDADRSPGLEVIRALQNDPATASIPVMLVSNFADAQQEAIAAGALAGFGKDELRAPETHARLATVLQSAGASKSLESL